MLLFEYLSEIWRKQPRHSLPAAFYVCLVGQIGGHFACKPLGNTLRWTEAEKRLRSTSNDSTLNDDYVKIKRHDK